MERTRVGGPQESRAKPSALPTPGSNIPSWASSRVHAGLESRGRAVPCKLSATSPKAPYHLRN